ncbi:hypothetical protein NESM_000321500 [Novymonas esmeraldas]|uniref:Trypanosoma Tc-38 (p38) protein domain-containing protein n=1 Tax=Novymonas esmeraldas TaxID=1808958 RepID=A0AAW0EMJ1_9TRYP
MFRSRCLARRLGAASVIGVLHPCRPLSCYATTPTQPTPLETAPQHHRSESGDGRGSSASPRHRRGSREGESAYPVSVLHTDEVANQATAALHTLLRQTRLSPSLPSPSPAAAEKAKEEAEMRRELPAAPRTDAASRAPAGVAATATTSNGEEELEECRGTYAEEAEADHAGRTTTTTTTTNTATSTTTEANSAPVNLYGCAYGGDAADALRRAARTHGFLSQIWSSRTSFERHGAHVVADEEDGVLLHIAAPSASVRLFNVEQTSLAAQLRAATLHEALEILRDREQDVEKCSYRRLLRQRETSLMPVSLIGRLLLPASTGAVMAAPRFVELMAQSRVWVREWEIKAIGAEVQPAEVESFVEVPAVTRPGLHRGSGAAHDGTAQTAVEEARLSAAVDVPEMRRFYNVAQLRDAARFTALDPTQRKLAPCYSSHGGRYSPAVTWLMWEYCERYNFPITGVPVIVFLTAERVRRLGGSISQAPHADGVVPPPFLFVMHDEVGTLYNAAQTNITDIAVTLAKSMASQRRSLYRHEL